MFDFSFPSRLYLHTYTTIILLTHQQGADADERMMEIASLDAIYSVQKMAEVLVAGPDSEREFILFELQQLLDHCLEDTMKILIPVLCEHVPTWNIDLQIKSAQRLYDVVCLDLDPATANMITCASFGVIHRAKGKAAPEYEELYNLWGGLLVDCLPNMQWSTQEIKDVVALVDIHSKEPLFTSRKVAARVIGALAQCLDKQRVEKIILPRAIQLFDDNDVEVRGTVVESLALIGAALPIRVTEMEVWPRVEGLLEPPEEARIRATAMRTMAHILESHRDTSGPSRLFRELLPPVFARLAMFSRKFAAEDQRIVDDDTYLLLEVASEVFGQFAYSLSLFTKKSFRKEAYKAYAGMATCNGPIIRRSCAFNLPGVAKALGERYALELSGLCDYLSNDMDEEVRWILAAGIHETTALLAPRGNFEKLFGAVCTLLQDEVPIVRMNALAHLHDILSAFAKDGTDPASLRRLAPVFADLTALSEGEWRIQKSLAEQLGKCADIIPPDALLENVLPLLFRLTKQGTPLVREAAMDAIARALRKIPRVSDRNAAIEKYWKAASKGPFWMRLALLDGGAAAMKVFSYKHFAELFASAMLDLASDPVANVRIRVASLLASMAPMCLGSAAYSKALDALRNDVDVDVRTLLATHDEAVRKALKIAHDRSSEDQIKLREEQEFYCLTQRTQKRARGRLGSAKANRIMMHVRRPSLEQQSSGQLSVSKAVISAAKASSAAASAMKAGYNHPRLQESDSAVYLGAAMEEITDMTGRQSHDSTTYLGLSDGHGEGDGGPSMPNANLLSSLAAHSESSEVNEHVGSTRPISENIALHQSERGRGRMSDDRGMTGSTTNHADSLNERVPVVQKTLGKAARYEARSKSWNGIMAQLPRQLSMESRSRKQQKAAEQAAAAAGGGGTNTGAGSGWTRGGKEEPRRKMSSLRKKKKREENMTSGDVSANGHEGATNDGHSADITDGVKMVDGSLTCGGPRMVAARAKSMVQSPSSSSLRVGPNVSTDGTSVDGDLASVPVVYEENGLPSFKGHAPWMRSKREQEDLAALSDAAHHRVFGTGEFDERAAAAAEGRKASGRKGTVGGTSEHSSRSEESKSGGGGFLRGLFRRKR